MRKHWLLISLIVIIFSVYSEPVSASAPYEGYNYGRWKTLDSPVPYVPEAVIRGNDLGIGEFRTPNDLFIARDGSIYLLDSGNGRIVIMDSEWRLKKVIDHFSDDAKEEKLNNSQGIYVTEQGEIFVADTENRRIVQMDDEGSFVRVIGTPESDVLREQFEFFPRKIALDSAKRIYAIGRGVYDGIMEFDAEGQFRGFIGTNRVRFNPIDYIWKVISTRAQREQMDLFLPVEFNNLHIDEEGFIYTTTSERFSNNPIQRLNSSGVDILRAEGYFDPEGDLEFPLVGSSMTGASTFIDITAGSNGTYSVLDSKRGRVFTYNEDGDLLYIFGQKGSQAGTFKDPVAVESQGDRLIVLDREYRHIVVFKPTAFGAAVNEGAKHYHEGRELEAEKSWRRVLELNANYEIAHIGIGKALLRQDKYKEAMTHFKNGYKKGYYSKAFTLYRKEVMRDYFGPGMTTVVILLVTAMFARYMLRRRKRRGASFDEGAN